MFFKVKLDICSPFSSQRDTFCRTVCFSRQSSTDSHLCLVQKTFFAGLCVFQGKAPQLLTFFKCKRRFLQGCVLFKAKLHSFSPFSSAKDVFRGLYAFQGKASQFLIFFKSKRRFLQNCMIFKAKFYRYSPFSNQKDTFCTAVYFSRQNITSVHLFQTKKTLFVQLYTFEGKV